MQAESARRAAEMREYDERRRRLDARERRAREALLTAIATYFRVMNEDDGPQGGG